MQELRAFQLANVAQGLQDGGQIVAINGPDVVETKFLEQRAGYHQAFDMLLGAARQFPHAGHLRQHFFAAFAHRGIELAGEDLRKSIGQRPDIGRYRHIVVIQDDEQIGTDVACVIECFKGHAGGEAAVANHGHRSPLAPRVFRGNRHSKRGADRRTGMPYAEGVIRAFVTFRERCNAAPAADGRHLVAATGQNLVRIGLMPHVPDDPILGRVVEVMQRDS